MFLKVLSIIMIKLKKNRVKSDNPINIYKYNTIESLLN